MAYPPIAGFPLNHLRLVYTYFSIPNIHYHNRLYRSYTSGHSGLKYCVSNNLASKCTSSVQYQFRRLCEARPDLIAFGSTIGSQNSAQSELTSVADHSCLSESFKDKNITLPTTFL